MRDSFSYSAKFSYSLRRFVKCVCLCQFVDGRCSGSRTGAGAHWDYSTIVIMTIIKRLVFGDRLLHSPHSTASRRKPKASIHTDITVARLLSLSCNDVC